MLRNWRPNPAKSALQEILWDISMETFFQSTFTTLVETLFKVASDGEKMRQAPMQMGLEELVEHMLNGEVGTGSQTQHKHETRQAA